MSDVNTSGAISGDGRESQVTVAAHGTGMSHTPGVATVNYAEPDWAVRGSVVSSLADFEERSRILRIYGFTEDQNLYVFVDKERRGARRVIAANGIFMVILALFIILLVSGVIPFCNH